MKKCVILFCMLTLRLQAQTDSLQFEGYYQQVNKYLYNGEKLDSGLYWANKMMNEAQTYYQKGLANFAKGNLIVLNPWEHNRGEFALSYLIHSVNIFGTQKNRDWLHLSLNSLALVYLYKYNPEQKLFAKHLRYQREAFKVQHDPSYRIKIPIVETLNDREATKSEILETIKVVSANLIFWEKQNSLPHLMWRNQLLGDLYWHLSKDFSKTEFYLQKAIGYAEKINDNSFRLMMLVSLCLYSNQSGEFEKAIKYGEMGLKQALVLKERDNEIKFRDQLYIAYKALKQFEKAYAHKEVSILFVEDKYIKSEGQRTQLLREKNTELQKTINLEKEVNRQNERQIIFYFLIVLLILSVMYFLVNNRKLKKQNKEISAAMLKGQATERKRVASDLHDNLGSTLSSIQWSLQAIDTSKMSKEELTVHQNLNQMLDNAYNQVRLLSHNLLPEDLEKQGLKSTLEGFVRKINKNDRLRLTLSFSENFPRLPPQTEFELYSICLELTNNILKHAGATEAAMVFDVTASMLTLTVSDNGRGINENKSKGYGLSNVAERVASLKGTWTVTSAPNEGAENLIRLPIY